MTAESTRSTLSSLQKTSEQATPFPPREFPFAPYVAFSLKAAQQQIQQTKGDFRTNDPNIWYIGGINRVLGFVCDPEHDDLMLVGATEIDRAPLTLDDLVVALRSRFVHGEWPLVSIDPSLTTEKTEIQRVRFEGGIRDTAFGLDLLCADYLLKLIAFGLVSPAVEGVESHWDKVVHVRRQEKYEIASRFWFYPTLSQVTVREGIAVCGRAGVGLFTEVLSAEVMGRKVENLRDYHDPTADEFAEMMSARFLELAKHHRSFARLRGLLELVGVAGALELAEMRPDIGYWLSDYPVGLIECPSTIQQVKRRQLIEDIHYEMIGGVQLRTLAHRLRAGDISALREAVLETRPSPNTLVWSFTVGEWIVPITTGRMAAEDMAKIVAQGAYLTQKKYYDDAITIWSRLIELAPNAVDAYIGRSLCYVQKASCNQAISDCNKAIEINPTNGHPYAVRATAYALQRRYDEAISDLNRALKLNPVIAEAYVLRALIHKETGQVDAALSDWDKAITITRGAALHDESRFDIYSQRGLLLLEKGECSSAISDFDKAIAINPEYVSAYICRGMAYSRTHQHDRAIRDYSTALTIDPYCAEAYHNRASTYKKKGDYDRALADFGEAIRLDPNMAASYLDRGVTFAEKGSPDRAISDYNKVLEINPLDWRAYLNRGIAYGVKGEYDSAISDFNKILELNPKDICASASAHRNRGQAYAELGEYGSAFRDFDMALEINPSDANTYIVRGHAYGLAGRYDREIADQTEAIRIDPKNALAYYNRGLAYCKNVDHERAISDYDKAIEINPSYYEAYANKAIASEEIGRPDEAAEAYRKFVQYCPPFKEMERIEDAKKRLRNLSTPEGRATCQTVPLMMKISWEPVTPRIEEIQRRSSFETLMKYLGYSDPETQAAAVEAMGNAKDPRAIEPLLNILRNAQALVRVNAAVALGRIVLSAGTRPDSRAMEALIRALEDPEWMVRSNAALALGEMKDEHALRPLLSAFQNDEHLFVRKNAAWAIKQIRGVSEKEYQQ